MRKLSRAQARKALAGGRSLAWGKDGIRVLSRPVAGADYIEVKGEARIAAGIGQAGRLRSFRGLWQLTPDAGGCEIRDRMHIDLDGSPPTVLAKPDVPNTPVKSRANMRRIIQDRKYRDASMTKPSASPSPKACVKPWQAAWRRMARNHVRLAAHPCPDQRAALHWQSTGSKSPTTAGTGPDTAASRKRGDRADTCHCARCS